MEAAFAKRFVCQLLCRQTISLPLGSLYLWTRTQLLRQVELGGPYLYRRSLGHFFMNGLKISSHVDKKLFHLCPCGLLHLMRNFLLSSNLELPSCLWHKNNILIHKCYMRGPRPVSTNRSNDLPILLLVSITVSCDCFIY